MADELTFRITLHDEAGNAPPAQPTLPTPLGSSAASLRPNSDLDEVFGAKASTRGVAPPSSPAIPQSTPGSLPVPLPVVVVGAPAQPVATPGTVPTQPAAPVTPPGMAVPLPITPPPPPPGAPPAPATPVPITPPTQPAQPFDAQAAARERLEKERQTRATQEAYEQLNPDARRDREARETAGRINRASTVVAATGRATAQIARNQAGAALTTAADTAAVALMALGPAGMVAGAALSLASTAVKAFTGTVEAFVSRANELATYSGEITEAKAKAEIRQIMADFNEAQALGGEYAGLTDAWSRLTTTVQEELIPIKRAILDMIIPLLEVLTSSVEFVKGFLDSLGFGEHGFWAGFFDTLFPWMKRNEEENKKNSERSSEERKRIEEALKDLKPIGILEEIFRGRSTPSPAPDQARGARNVRNVPPIAGGF